MTTTTFFATAADFRAWLEKHHESASELVVGFRKVGSGMASMTWSESVDEALCFGWIDGVRRRIDDTSYSIRFTPRRRGSNWSAVNLEKVKSLIAEGRMRPAGLRAYESRDEKKCEVYSFERERPAELERTELLVFRKNKPAWAYFQSTPPGYRKTILHWIVSAKRPETRSRRFAQLVQACSEQRRIY